MPWLALAVLLTTPPAPPAAALREVLATSDDARAAQVAASLDGLPVPADSSDRLHAALVRPAHPSGIATLRVPLDEAVVRDVVVRVPREYDPTRRWPLLLVYHWSGGSAAEAMAATERQLGPAIDSWVVAAPHHYRQTGLDAPPPFRDEHRLVLRALRATFHVDADRTVVLGWSLGGYTAWMWALLHPDEIAAAIALAATTSTPPGPDGLWEAVAGNAATIPILTAWGSRDTLEVTGIPGMGRIGTISSLNRRLARDPGLAGFPWRFLELPGRSHGVFAIDGAALEPLLAARRPPPRESITRHFRHLHQGDLGWIAATELAPGTWTEQLPGYERAPGESREQAQGRAIRAALPALTGRRVLHPNGSERIEIETHLVRRLVVRFACSSLRQPRSVSLTVDDQKIALEAVRPSLAGALLEARRTGDLDRLWCAQVEVEAPPPADLSLTEPEDAYGPKPHAPRTAGRMPAASRRHD